MSTVTRPKTQKRIVINRAGLMRQKWSANFIGDNNLTLAKTSEHYHNLGDLKSMLHKYFPDWPITVPGRTIKDR